MLAHDIEKKEQERRDFRTALLNIYRNPQTCPTPQEARQIADYIDSAYETDSSVLLNEFGINRISLALKSIELAIDEIGLHGDVLKAYLLQQFIKTDAQCDVIEHFFNKEIAQYIRIFLRIRNLEVKTSAMRTDNFQNLLISQAEDMRILLMLIADCVCLMRRIKNTENVAAQKKVSYEAAYLYAPLAHKLGLYQLKSELEDLSLKYLEHDAYYMIKDNLNATKRSRDAYIERFTQPIRQMLDQAGLRYHLKGRTKSIHSIWQKMKKQQCGFNGVYDLFAIRIILDSPLAKEQEQCWKAFSLITNKYESNLKRLRDWLSVPKSNGYESLHITVKGPEDKWVEVQIRTERMDEIAEHGLAAHWRYKGVKSTDGGVDSWLADIRSALETGNDSLLTESLSTEIKEQDIYVFSPKGDLYRLPPRSTVLDFAYTIHSEIGNKCIGGRIGGKTYSIRKQLESGQTIEILTSNSQEPKAEWINIAQSVHARSKIRATVRDLAMKESSLGKEILERKMRNRKIEYNESLMNQLIKKLGYKEYSDFYKDLTDENIDVNEALDVYLELNKREQGTAERAAVRSAEEFKFEQESTKSSTRNTPDELVIGSNIKGLDYQLARCCNPVYGDDVFGFVTVSGGIKIHRMNCPNAPALRQRFDYRIIKARWAGENMKHSYPITLYIVGQDDLGIVNNITSIISKEEHIMLRNINIDAHDGLFTGILTITISDLNKLNSLIRKIQTVKGVKAVSRS